MARVWGGGGWGVGSMTSKYPALEEKKDIVRRHARLARVRRRGRVGQLHWGHSIMRSRAASIALLLMNAVIVQPTIIPLLNWWRWHSYIEADSSLFFNAFLLYRTLSSFNVLTSLICFVIIRVRAHFISLSSDTIGRINANLNVIGEIGWNTWRGIT